MASAPANLAQAAGQAAVTASAPATAAAPTHEAIRTAPASPAEQIAAPLMSLGPVQSADGTQRLTVRLDPKSLGSVEIAVDRARDAPAKVVVTVERPETLTLLLRDENQLQQALTQAGIPPDGRTVAFHVANTPPRGDPTSPSFGADPGAAGSGSGSGADSGGDRGGARDQGGGQRPSPALAARIARWSRAGLDITA